MLNGVFAVLPKVSLCNVRHKTRLHVIGAACNILYIAGLCGEQKPRRCSDRCGTGDQTLTTAGRLGFPLVGVLCRGDGCSVRRHDTVGVNRDISSAGDADRIATAARHD